VSLRRTLIPIVLSLVVVTHFFPATNFTPRQAAAATTCDWAQFIADVTVPDGTTFVAGTVFTKVWRLKNIGSCTWTTSYAVIFYSGYQMDAPDAVGLISNVAPGETVDITVNMTAPYAPGHYRSYWRLRNAAGVQFGLGSSHAATFWADINVTASTSVENAYDFSANFCSAAWTSGAGALPCPGTTGDARGFVTKVDSLTLEDGSLSSNPGLLVGPQQVAGGYVQAAYPPITVQAGDHFQSIINCSYGAQNCYVNFRLEYQVGSGPVRVFWNFFERYEGLYYRADLDLSPLAGQEVKFILYVSDVSGHGVPSSDRALWGWPRITRMGGGPIPTVPPAATDTPQPMVTETPQPTVAPTATGQPQPTGVPSYCNQATFISDVTIPDGTQLAAGSTFTKTWRIKNNSICTWTTSYGAVFYGGTQMGPET
jgi:hypothetical protein